MVASFVTILLITSVMAPTLIHTVAGAPFDPWTNGWQYRKQITIDHTKVSATLTSFPVLINITDNDLKTKAQSSGNDILFMDGVGSANKLDHEIELYRSSDGHLVAWVRIPTLSSTVDTTFYMYYGNGGASNQQNAAGVWDSSFRMVQHLKETSGTHTDSTSNGNTGTVNGGVTQGVAGKIDGADNFDGVDDRIDVAHSNSLNLGTGDFTVSVWVKYSSNNVDADILRKGNMDTAPEANYKMELLSNAISGTLQGSNPGGGGTVTSSTTNDDNNWHNAVFRRQTGTISLYVDGALKATQGSAGIDLTNTANLAIGAKAPPPAEDFLAGMIDEVQILNVALSPSWITTSYNSMNSPATFYTSGTEEQNPTSTTVVSLNAISPQFYKRGSTVPYSGTATNGGSPVPDNTDVGIVVKDRLGTQVFTDTVKTTGGAFSSNFVIGSAGAEGLWTIYIAVGAAQDSKTFYLDDTSPSSSVTTPTAGSYVTSVPTIAGTASDPNLADGHSGSGVASVAITIKRSSDNLYWTGSTWGSLTWLSTIYSSGSWSYSASGVSWTTGAYAIVSKATDGAGNSETPGVGITFNVDTTAPTSSVTSPSGWISSVSTISGTVTDTGGSGVKYVVITLRRSTDSQYWTGSTWGSLTWLNTTLGAGTWTYTPSGVTWTSGATYTVAPQAKDNAGNSAAGTSGSFSYDNTAPTSAVTSPADGSYVYSVTTISGTANDGSGSGVASVAITIKRSSDNLYWTGSTWGSLTWLSTTYAAGSWSYGASGVTWTSGEYSVVSKATDTVGNVETPGAGIHFDLGALPTATVTGAYHGARLSWTSVSALSYNIYYNTVNNPDTATQFTTGVTALTYDVKNLPSSTWGATCYFWIAPVTSGGETPKTSWGLGQTTPPDKIWAYKVEVTSVTVATAVQNDIKIDFQFRSRYLEAGGLTVNLQIGEYFGPGTVSNVPNRPITIMTTGPATLPSFLSSGLFSFETQSNSEIQSGKTYKAWIYLWNQFPSELGNWEPFTAGTEKMPITIP